MGDRLRTLHKILLLSALLFLAALFHTPHVALAQEDGGALFKAKCSACHTVGGGRLVGPDLLGVTARRDRSWLTEFITTPDKAIAGGDPVATQLVKEYGMAMPNLGVTPAQAEFLLAYIEAQSGGAKPSPATGTAQAPPAGDAAIGRDLFTGKRPLANGGTACVACHNIAGIGTLGGGTMGLDLTNAYSKFGDAGLTSILHTTPFPVMKDIFPTRPITDEEVTHLKALLREADSQKGAPAPSAFGFPLAGVVGLALSLLVAQTLWGRRLRGVRKPLVRGDER